MRVGASAPHDGSQFVAEARLNDILRQFAVVLTAISQVYFSYSIGREVGGIAQENRSLILPASYAFSIWGAIFLLCLLYAVYQALPANRESPIFRAVGWWTAGAFVCNTIWNQIFISRQFVLSQVVIFCGLLFAGVAFFRFVQTARPGHLSSVENWVVAPALGLLFGWLTAANVVGLASVLVANGFAPTGQGAEIGGAALLLFGSAIAFFVIVLTRTGPSSAWVAHGATIIWALVAVFLEQRAASMLVGLTAIVGIALVVAALVGPWSRERQVHVPATA
jgi:hypothetical protein